MTLLDDMFAEGFGPLMNEMGGEQVTYHFAAGGSRTVTAVVNRNPRRPIDAVPGPSIAPFAIVTIDDDETTGVAATELDTGGDEVEYAVRLGGAPERRPVAKLNEQRGGKLILEVH